MINKILASIIIFFVGFTGKAQQLNNRADVKGPKVGLVLSGGGAKGFAYIGLFKVLQEVNMPIDYIGGSSMGAITAALYSVGYSPEEMEKIIGQQDWSAVINDIQDRKYISYEEKLFSDKYIYSIPFKDNGISLSKSLSSSFNIDLMLNKLFLPVAHITDFNHLPVPFLCIGTDLLTGEAVVLNKGNLARAVRASMAIPGYFTPIEYDGKHLVDGGVVNNYPAEQVKAMGADIIIGGDVQSGLTDDIEKLSSLTSILDQVISFNRVEANIKGAMVTDLHINIPMSFGMMQFNAYDSIITIGENIAREYYPQLKALADSINAIRNFVYQVPEMKPVESIKLEKVEFVNFNQSQKEQFYGYFDEIENNLVPLSVLEEKLYLLNGTRKFDELTAEFVPAGNDSLSMKISAGNTFKGSLSAGLHYDNIYNGGIILNLALRNIKKGNSKFFVDAILSQNPRIKSLFIINNGFKPGFGLETDFYTFHFNQYKNGEKINFWRFNSFNIGTFMPLTIKNNYLFKTGFQYEVFQFKQDVVLDPELDAYSAYSQYGNLFFSFNYDSRDKVSFTKKGQLVELKVKHIFPLSKDWKEFFSNSTVFYLNFQKFMSLSDKIVFKPELFLGYTLSDMKPVNLPEESNSGRKNQIPPVHHLFGFGGLNPVNYVESHIPFTGLKFVERIGGYAGKLGTSFQYNFYSKLYATLMADFGLNEQELSNFQSIDWLFGYGVKVSYESFIGPVELSIMSSNVDTSVSSFINIGFWF